MVVVTARLSRRYLGITLVFFIMVAIFPALLRFLALDGGKPQPVYSGNPARAEVALACNIFWGEEFLPAMLDILDGHGVKITFFIGGSWAAEHPALLQELHQRGHELGNHSYSHPHPNTLSRAANQDQIARTDKLIATLTGFEARLYAPPYGEFNDSVLAAATELGHTTILWSIDTIDWQNPPPAKIISRVTNKLHNGAIILIHPTKPTREAMPELLDRIKAAGYRIVPVGALIDI